MCYLLLTTCKLLTYSRFTFWVWTLSLGTRCRGGVKVLWCHSHLVRLVVEGSILTCSCFSFRKLFCDLFLLYFFFGMVKEKRGGRTGQGEGAWSRSVKYETIERFGALRSTPTRSTPTKSTSPNQLSTRSTPARSTPVRSTQFL